MSEVHICGPHLTVPNDKHECMEAVYSQGRSCKKCEHPNCYRVGWEKAKVDADNRRLCKTPTKADMRAAKVITRAFARRNEAIELLADQLEGCGGIIPGTERNSTVVSDAGDQLACS